MHKHKYGPHHVKATQSLTVGLAENDAVDDIRARVAARVPCILIARERAPIERRVGVRNVGHERLRDRKVCLQSQRVLPQIQQTAANIVVMAHRPVLKVDVVSFEIDVAEERLQRSAVCACTDEGCVE